MAKKDYEEKYTHPEMREEIKEEIKASDKGGDPGQWSARKSQFLKQEYERRGGGYVSEPDEDQKNLRQWTEEEWQTKEGEAEARGGGEGGQTKRYLPKEAWEKMSEKEKRQTEQKKQEGSSEGRQYVSNTGGAKQARAESHGPPIRGYDELNVAEIEKKAKGLSKQEIEEVKSYEKRHQNRKTLLESLDSRQ